MSQIGRARHAVPAALRADLDAREATKRGLQLQLEETLVKTGAYATQAKEQGYQQSQTDIVGNLRKVLVTLASDFQEDNYFEAYLHYVDEQ